MIICLSGRKLRWKINAKVYITSFDLLYKAFGEKNLISNIRHSSLSFMTKHNFPHTFTLIQLLSTHCLTFPYIFSLSHTLYYSHPQKSTHLFNTKFHITLIQLLFTHYNQTLKNRENSYNVLY